MEVVVGISKRLSSRCQLSVILKTILTTKQFFNIQRTIITQFTSKGIMVTKVGQHIHLLERMSGVTPPKGVVTPMARSAPILTNIHILTFGGATVTKWWLQLHLMEKSVVTTSRRVLVTSQPCSHAIDKYRQLHFSRGLLQ